jgi:molybdate transport system substrate-binding protein
VLPCAGASKPDISSVDALRRALLAANSIAYSDSASGAYVSTELFKRLGIADQVAGKSRMMPAEPVGAVVPRGEAEIGFQQVSELKAIAGIDLVGPLPAELQKITIFSAGIVVGAREPDAARALIAFLASPTAAAAIRDSGLEPMTSALPRIKNGSKQAPRLAFGTVADKLGEADQVSMVDYSIKNKAAFSLAEKNHNK